MNPNPNSKFFSYVIPDVNSESITGSLTRGMCQGCLLALMLVLLLLSRVAPVQAQEALPVLQAVPVNNILSANDTARYLAGLKPLENGRAAELAATAAWQEHAQALGADWDRFGSRSWRRIRSWSGSEISGFGNARSPVFYPFSGPDFIYVYNYFPQASAYLLCGLEPAGDIPDLARMDSGSLSALRNSMHTLLTAGYFVTKSMRMELRGTLPLMFVMLARSGCTITHVERFKSGAEVRFLPEGGGGERRLIYVSADLSNGGFNKGELAARLSQLNPKNAYIKSASYLMHQDGFSAVRTFLLNHCNLIVQDDSGIPARFFSPQKWTLRLYGAYTPPLNLFKQYMQPDLADLYLHTPTKSLDFGAGYKWNPREATLIVASTK